MRAKDEFAGMQVKCPGCAAIVTVQNKAAPVVAAACSRCGAVPPDGVVFRVMKGDKGQVSVCFRCYGDNSLCSRCGKKRGILDVLSSDLLADSPYTCSDCVSFLETEARANRKRIQELARDVIVTSTPSIEGWRIRHYMGIESVEYVIGTGLFSEFTSSVNDFFGQRSSAFEKKLREAKTAAMATLKYVAAERGANAVVAVDMDYAEFSGNRVALILNGTLVEIERIKEPTSSRSAAQS
jgi:uncharacterized protein YbjQ (UPF0145 family)